MIENAFYCNSAINNIKRHKMQKLTLLSTITRFYPNHLIKSWVHTKLSILITLGKYSGGKGILQIPIAINAMYLWSFCYKLKNKFQNTGGKVNLSIWVKSRLKKLKPNSKRILPNLWFAVVYGKKNWLQYSSNVR